MTILERNNSEPPGRRKKKRMSFMDNFHRVWNGVATDVRGMDSTDMIKAAGLSDPIKKEAIFTANNVEIPKQFALTRNGQPLGLVGSTYRAWSESELFGMFDQLQGVGGFRFHSAGSLHGTAQPWVMAQLGKNFRIARPDGSHDELGRFLMLTHSHGGRVMGNNQSPLLLGGMTGRFTCSNMLPTFRSTSWRIQHTASSELKLETAIEAIRGSLLMQDEDQRIYQELSDQRIAKAQVRGWAEDLMLDMEKTMDSVRDDLSAKKRNQVERDADTIADLFVTGDGNQGLTKWDALNGLSHYTDHVREPNRKASRNVQGRFKDAYFGGNGPGLKRRAIRTLRSL